MVGELDDWHLGTRVDTGDQGLNLPHVDSMQELVTYCSFVQNLDRIGAGHIALLQGLLQFLQWWVVPLSKHHQVNVTVTTNMRNIQNICFSIVFPTLIFNLNLQKKKKKKRVPLFIKNSNSKMHFTSVFYQ